MEGDNEVLYPTGYHTYEARISVGMTCSVTVVASDEETARRLILADRGCQHTSVKKEIYIYELKQTADKPDPFEAAEQ